MTLRLITVVFLGSFGLGAILAAPIPQKQRSGSQLCSELTREVNISAERGLLTQSEADRISARCYRLYGGKSDV